jgi:hypothetical protein
MENFKTYDSKWLEYIHLWINENERKYINKVDKYMDLLWINYIKINNKDSWNGDDIFKLFQYGYLFFYFYRHNKKGYNQILFLNNAEILLDNLKNAGFDSIYKDLNEVLKESLK